MIKVKKKLLTIISLLFIVACFGGKNIVNNTTTVVNYNELFNHIKIKDNNNIYKIKLNNKNIIKGEISYFIDNNNLFIISNSKNLIKISLKNKNIAWIKKLATTPYDNFIFDKKNIYFNGIDNNFYILNYNTGNIGGIFFNTNKNTIFDIKQPHIYKNYVVAFFTNNEIFIINNLTNKVIKIVEYNSIDIQNNIITIDNNEIINLNNLEEK